VTPPDEEPVEAQSDLAPGARLARLLMNDLDGDHAATASERIDAATGWELTAG